MNIKEKLNKLILTILEEAENNSDFAEKLSKILNAELTNEPRTKKRGGRRSPAALDPVALFLKGEGELRNQLKSLDIEQLRDIVAEYGMDPSKLVMKWKTEDRVIDHIVEYSSNRAKKGEAFR